MLSYEILNCNLPHWEAELYFNYLAIILNFKILDIISFNLLLM